MIGKVCAIATGAKFMMNDANHRLDGPTTFPFPIFGRDWLEPFRGDFSLSGRGDTVVGNDVWIGYDSLILPGVTIGDGAVVGARAAVMRDVPPYAVVAGNPARVVRMRFDEAAVARLLEIRWWELGHREDHAPRHGLERRARRGPRRSRLTPPFDRALSVKGRQQPADEINQGAEIAEPQEDQQDERSAHEVDVPGALGLVAAAAFGAALGDAAHRRAAMLAGAGHAAGSRPLSCTCCSRRRCRGRSPPGG